MRPRMPDKPNLWCKCSETVASVAYMNNEALNAVSVPAREFKEL